MENHFKPFREQILGKDKEFNTPYGVQEILYADWTASGRTYKPIEQRLMNDVLPFVGNTHTETTVTGTYMTKAYDIAKSVVKKHVNASDDDVLIFAGSGMTAAVNKLQRMMGLKIPERTSYYLVRKWKEGLRFLMGRKKFHLGMRWDSVRKPVVFISHLEHHSNQTSWLETIADVEIIEPTEDGLMDFDHLKRLLKKYRKRDMKIASISACSNVTGVKNDFYQVAEIMHAHDGYCFVDFACSAPYVDMDMHPEGRPSAYLDAIFFSPHKFLGGPGSPGVLVFNSGLYNSMVPDNPGGGTVTYTNPWKFHQYINDIEAKEDGGTPPFLQGIKAAMAVRLKEQMGIAKMAERDKHLVGLVFDHLGQYPQIEILAGHIKDRLPVFSMIVKDMHYNLVARILNDRFGIQTRGGCACAGTYGHYLLGIDEQHSLAIFDEIHKGNESAKPGWVRFSLHPTMTDDEVVFICNAIKEVCVKGKLWAQDYEYLQHHNEYKHRSLVGEDYTVDGWFSEPLTV